MFIVIWIRMCNGMLVDIFMERFSEIFILLEFFEFLEVRWIFDFIVVLGKLKNIIFWFVLIVLF